MPHLLRCKCLICCATPLDEGSVKIQSLRACWGFERVNAYYPFGSQLKIKFSFWAQSKFMANWLLFHTGGKPNSILNVLRITQLQSGFYQSSSKFDLPTLYCRKWQKIWSEIPADSDLKLSFQHTFCCWNLTWIGWSFNGIWHSYNRAILRWRDIGWWRFLLNHG